MMRKILINIGHSDSQYNLCCEWAKKIVDKIARSNIPETKSSYFRMIWLVGKTKRKAKPFCVPFWRGIKLTSQNAQLKKT
jgi:hypothetical protein